MGLINDEFDYLEEEKVEDTSQEKSTKVEVKQEVKPEEKSVEDSEKKDEEKVKEKENIFAIKVTTNKENRALELISDRVKSKNLNVYSIARPHGLRGYIFLEAEDRENAEEASYNLPYVKGLIPKRLAYSELKSMLEPVTADVKIEKDDIVEIISEPFKKEKAKVIRVDKSKDEVIVSLLGAIIPIPVTVKIDNIRVIRREDEEDS